MIIVIKKKRLLGIHDFFPAQKLQSSEAQKLRSYVKPRTLYLTELKPPLIHIYQLLSSLLVRKLILLSFTKSFALKSRLFHDHVILYSR